MHVLDKQLHIGTADLDSVVFGFAKENENFFLRHHGGLWNHVGVYCVTAAIVFS